MIRLLLIALGVISLELGSQEIGLALDCKPAPEQTSADWEGEVDATVAKIGPVSGGAAKGKLKVEHKDLLGKLPDAGKVYLELTMLAMYCSSVRDDKTISETRKTEKIKEYIADVRAAIWPKPPAVVPQASKPKGEKKASVPQSKDKSPATPPPQAEPKLPETPKSQSAESQSPSISQQSAGANSPNVVGDQNVVILNSARARDLEIWMLRQSHLAQLQPLLRRESDNFVIVADRARTVGRISNLNNGTEPDFPELELLLSPEVLSQDLANHYPEYWQKKQELLKDILRQDAKFGDTVVLVSKPVYLPNHAENQRVTVGHAFIDRCLGHGPGIAVEEYPNGGYSYRILQGGGSNSAGHVSQNENVTAILNAFKSISPTAETAKRCEALTEGAASISVKAKELSLMAKRLALRTVLAGDCEYTKLD